MSFLATCRTASLLFASWSLVCSTAALAAAPPETLLSDNFKFLKPGWGKGGPQFYAKDDAIVMTPEVGTGRIQLYDQPVEGDLDIRVEVAQTLGGTDSIAGLTFWAADYDNCLLVAIDSAGQLAVKNYIAGVRGLPCPLRPVVGLRKGLGKTNELRVVTRGHRFHVYVNGAWVLSMRGFPPAGPSKFGLYGQSIGEQYIWKFTNYLVRRASVENDGDARDPAILLADNFDTLDVGWGAPDDQVVARDRRLVVDPIPGGARRVTYRTTRFKDADIQATVKNLRNGATESAGLLFWSDGADNFNLAAINDGKISFFRTEKGKTSKTGSVADPVIKQGDGAENSIRIVIRAGAAEISVNGKHVAKITGGMPEAGGLIGFYAEGADAGGSTWEFSDFQVRKPEPAAEEKQK